MKKLLLLLACATVLFACDKDDDKGKTPEKPQSGLFSEPILTFGTSKATIKQQEKRTFVDENATSLGYRDGKNLVIYQFENDKLAASVVVLPLNTDAKKLVNFLSSKYTVVGTDGEYFVWELASKNMSIVVSVEAEGIFVIYMPTPNMVMSIEKMPSLQRAPLADDATVNEVKNAIRQQIQ